MGSGQPPLQQKQSAINTSVNTSQSATSQNNLLKKAKTNIASIPLLNSQISAGAAQAEAQDCAPEKRANQEALSTEESLIKLQPIQVVGAVTTVAETAEQVKEKCRQRLEEYKKQIKKTMPLSDQLDMRDPQCIAEFAQEVF